MPLVAKDWPETSAFFKAEGGQVNVGLGHGPALDIFNDGIKSYRRIG